VVVQGANCGCGVCSGCGGVVEVYVAIVVRWTSVGYCGDFRKALWWLYEGCNVAVRVWRSLK